MLEIGKANEVTFKVAVNGTSATPKVRLVIETPDAELGFSANQGDGYWFSQVFIPEDIKAGDYMMRVEVVVNNRLFTPVKKMITIASLATIPAAEEAAPEQAKKQEEDAVQPEQPVQPEKVPAPTPPPRTGSLLKETAAKAVGAPVKLTLTNKKKPAFLFSGMPKGTGKKSKPVQIKIADIVAESNRRFDDVLAESSSYRSPIKPIEHHIPITPQTPVSLRKGAVIYE